MIDNSNEYNDHGMTTVYNTLAGPIYYEYTDEDLISKMTLPGGAVWLFEYDERGNTVRKTMPDGRTLAFEYDEQNRMCNEYTMTTDNAFCLV